LTTKIIENQIASPRSKGKELGPHSWGERTLVCHSERSEESIFADLILADPYFMVLRTASTQAVAKMVQDDKNWMFIGILVEEQS